VRVGPVGYALSAFRERTERGAVFRGLSGETITFKKRT
jgi:hypothetical protein